jgi:hypothetical protein
VKVKVMLDGSALGDASSGAGAACIDDGRRSAYALTLSLAASSVVDEFSQEGLALWGGWRVS